MKDVIFKEPVNITSIGTDAFKTQEVEYHKADCGNKDATDVQQLYFTGPISDDSAPFNYAMDPNSYINRGNQERTYITYYSGWPKNLEVKYNPDTDKMNWQIILRLKKFSPVRNIPQAIMLI